MPYRNPIIPGFYPDPSICRVKDEYYLVNSSFEYFPGVPLWHSDTLFSWEQKGYVLTRESQLELGNCPASAGVFAPTIREHNGTFYMITTNVNLFPKGTPNFIVHTDDINGEWSEPVYIDQMGIDPTLFFDDNGDVYYAGTGFDETGKQGIVLFMINPLTGDIKSEKKYIWYGTGGRNPEGPHLYKKDNMYYLMIAEGGTEYGHMVTVARSENIWGPYESCPYNPVLSHRDNDKSIFQCVGHADLVETKDHEWYAVFHAVRPSAAQLHHIGRETMLAKVTWKDGWPLINNKQPISVWMGETEKTYRYDDSFTDCFDTKQYHPKWSWLRNPDLSLYIIGDGLQIKGSSFTLDDTASASFMGVRQTQMELDCMTEMSLEGNGTAGICVYHTNEHHYDLHIRKTDTGYGVSLKRRVADMTVNSEEFFIAETDHLILKIVAVRNIYSFYAGKDEEHLISIGTGSTQLMSTEVMKGTFTGCFFGLFAEGDACAKFRYFKILESKEQKEKNAADLQREYPV